VAGQFGVVSRLQALQPILERFRERRPLRGGSLIITVFGDSISQHGNSVWLGSLIRALEPFGLNSRLIRTAVHRLAGEQWLESRQRGRRSYYSFTASGMRRYAKAAQRIYAAGSQAWDGRWTLVFCQNLADDARDTLRKELTWLGYGAINSSVLLHPGQQARNLGETLRDMGVEDQVVVLRADTSEITAAGAIAGLAGAAWPLEENARRYQGFIDDFRPLAAELETCANPDPEEAFQARTLVIHEYRRILLRDSDLPRELLPRDWVGSEALRLVSAVYRRTSRAAETFLETRMETEEGPLPKADPSYSLRFGGL